MHFFRNGKGRDLLTRNYDGDGANWGDYVLNISVNEALRTRGDRYGDQRDRKGA